MVTSACLKGATQELISDRQQPSDPTRHVISRWEGKEANSSSSDPCQTEKIQWHVHTDVVWYLHRWPVQHGKRFQTACVLIKWQMVAVGNVWNIRSCWANCVKQVLTILCMEKQLCMLRSFWTGIFKGQKLRLLLDDYMSQVEQPSDYHFLCF